MTRFAPCTALLLVTLTGCAHGTTTAAAAVEHVVHVHAATAPAPLVGEYGAGEAAAFVTPTGVTAERDATVDNSTNAPSISTVSTPVGQATLDLAAAPTGSFHAIPVFASEQQVTAVRFAPAAAQASFKLSPTWGVPAVTTIACTVTDESGQHAVSYKLSAATLGWPRAFEADTTVALPLDGASVLAFFQADPTAKQMKLTAGLLDAQGQALRTKAGTPLTLSLALAVL